MPTFIHQSTIDATPEEVYRWHARDGAFDRLSPPWQQVRTVAYDGGLFDGSRRVMKMGPRPVAVTWEAIHRDHVEGRQFVDEQVKGPFKRWVHRHRFEPCAEGKTRLIDEVNYELPLSPVSSWMAGPSTRRMLERLFAFRHRRTAEDLRRHRRQQAALTVAITGASGMIGAALCAFLETGGPRVIRLVRRRDQVGPDAIYWSPASGELDPADLEGVDAVIHLAGEPVVGRWTSTKRCAIEESRVQGTRLLADAIAEADGGPRVFLSASAVGYYGDSGDRVLSEDSDSGQGFLAHVCRRWEEATEQARRAGVRTVQMRLGVVLSPRGGALVPMQRASALSFASRLGDGRQYVPWIDLDDVLGAMAFLLNHPTMEGPVNLCAPQPLRNETVMKTIAEVIDRPAVIPVPEAALALAMGQQAADETVLVSQQVVPRRLLHSGFQFFYPDLFTSVAVHLGQVSLSAPPSGRQTMVTR